MHNLISIRRAIYQELEDFLLNIDFREISDRNIDHILLRYFEGQKLKRTINGYDIEFMFLEPRDTIYRAEGGRTPYDILINGRIDNCPFMIFLNNKVGNLESSARNDTTTYNNLIRLYLGINRQRFKKEITLNKRIILNRIRGDEIISYALFVIDINVRKSNFFLLEEIDDDFYVNPRNNMFQVKYKPTLRKKPRTYFEFVDELLNASIEAIKKAINSSKTELLALEYIKSEIYLLENENE
jgi:hypothetical protein